MTREVVKKSRSPQPDLQKGGGASAVVRALIRDGQRLVLKDFSRSPSWFRRTIGALLARHESAAYRRLDGLHWVPRFLGRQPPDGVLMGFVEIEQWAQAGPRLSSNFFEELQRCLRMVRSRGVLHLDVARNVRVGPGEKPILFDFASSLVIPKCLWFLKPALCKLRSPYDERVVIKLKARHAPHLLRPGDERKLERDLAGEVWIKPVERLLRGGVSLFQEAMSSGFRLLVTRFVYSGLIEIVTWFVLVPWHLLLILLSRFSWEELNQRLGRATPTHTSAPRIHLHAVSVGETAVAENVLREMLPDERVEVVLTAGNRPGLKVARALRQRRPEVVDVALLPWDRQGATRSWLKRLRPDVVAIVETEIWPNLFLLCAEMDIPLLMINARLYAEDVPRYRMMRHFFGHVLGATTWIAVTDENEWKRFLQIGAPRERLLLAGNAKYDQLRDLRGSGMRKDLSLPKESFVICAASTHHPEEKLLLRLFSELLRDAGGKDYQARPLPRQDAGPAWDRVSSSNGASTTGNNTDLRLILAPRDVRRSGPVARQAERLGLETALWPGPGKAWQVLIIGEYGWLPEMFEASDLVFMGGSFAPIGGHNFLEAAARRKPIVVGPHFHNFAEPLASFLQRGAIVRVRNPEDLGRALKELIGDEKGRRNLGQAAFRFIQRGSGASRRYADLLRACLRGTQSQDKSAPRGPAEAGEVPHNF